MKLKNIEKNKKYIYYITLFFFINNQARIKKIYKKNIEIINI